MANDIDSLITRAENRGVGFAATTDLLVSELRNFIGDSGTTGFFMPGKTVQNGITVDASLDLTGVALPAYVEPTKAASPDPVYEPPTATLPSAPDLADVGTVTIPPERDTPVLNISGLFQQSAPSSNLPEFNESDPDLNVDGLVAEIDAIARPVLQELVFPTLTPFGLGDAPTLELPSYDTQVMPDLPDSPDDYHAQYEAAYRQMLPEMQAFIDDKVATWISKYAPEYESMLDQLSQEIAGGMDGGVLPDQFEAALFTRAKGRSDEEYGRVENDLLTFHAKRGMAVMPGELKAGLHMGRLKSAASLANVSNDIYVERRRSEVQHKQFVMGLAQSQVQGARGLAVNYAGTLASTLQSAAEYANSFALHSEKIYDHVIARVQLRLSIIEAVGQEYDRLLKGALSALDGYRLALDAEKQKKDVEIAQIQFIEAQIRAEELSVQNYTAMVDAVTRKAEIEKLKLEGYGIRADIAKNKIAFKLGEFDVYKASLEGDKYKQEGELSKLKVLDSQLNGDNLRLEAQNKAIAAVVARNDAQIKIFENEGEVYKLELDNALQKYVAAAEIKKLAETVYSHQIENASQVYNSKLEVPKILMDALIKEYVMRVETALKEAELNFEKVKLGEQASEMAVKAYENMAVSLFGSLNTMVSSAVQAAA